MSRPSKLLRDSLACALVAVASTSCGGGGSVIANTTITIAAVTPAIGSIGIEPTQVLTFVLASPSSSLSASDVVVSDGGNQLPGALRQQGVSTTWTWTPDAELPRGATCTAFVRGALATRFTVRDFRQEAQFELLGLRARETLSWPNGRRVVTTVGGRVFEVGAAGLTERFVDVPEGARPFGDGSFLGEELVAGQRFCVRGNLDGTREQIRTPFDVAIGDHNAQGDVAAFVPNTIGNPGDWGLYRLAADSLQWQFAGSLSMDEDRDDACIATDGTVAIAHRDGNRIHLDVFPVGDLVGEHYELPFAASTPRFAFGAGRSGILACRQELPFSSSWSQYVAHAARYVPGVGLQDLPRIYDWGACTGNVDCTIQGVNHTVTDVHVGSQGSACVTLAEGLALGPAVRFAVRIEADDSITDRIDFETPSGDAHVSPRRAELWAMSRPTDPSRLELVRSRPDGSQSSTVYRVPVGGPAFDEWRFSFDDSGRALLALIETAGTSVTTRLLFFE